MIEEIRVSTFRLVGFEFSKLKDSIRKISVAPVVTKVVDNRKKVSSSNSPTTVSTNKTAVIEDEEDVKKNSPIQKQQGL